MIPRIVRWRRMNNVNVFTAPSNSLPLLEVCHEARDEAFLYGGYILLPSPQMRLYYSPKIDYLYFHPGWIGLQTPGASLTVPLNPGQIPLAEVPGGALNTLPMDLNLIRNIMVLPNYTDERMRPTVQLEMLPMLKQVLVAADEKSIDFHSKFMLATVYDTQKYYEGVKRKHPDTKMPFVAVGCLRWVGEERRRMVHREEDRRELVAVLENHLQIRAHATVLRQEEKQFMKEQFSSRRPGLILNFRRPRWDGLGGNSPSTSSRNVQIPSEPPAYLAITTPRAEVEASRIDFDHRPAQNQPSDHLSFSGSSNHTSEHAQQSTRSQQSQDSDDSSSKNHDSEDDRTSEEGTWVSIETQHSEQLQKVRRDRSKSTEKPQVKRGKKLDRVRYWWRKVSFKRARIPY